MGFIKTFAVAAGAAAVLGGAGIGVAQASSSAPTVAPSTSSTSSTHEDHARHTGTDDGARHESEARGRVAEGETHARHTGTDDSATPSATPSAGHDLTDDHGSGGHGADD